MDPITQGVFSACLPAAFARGYEIRLVAFCGLVAGLLPSLDAWLIPDGDHPMLGLAYGRQFLYSVTLVPLLAVLTALIVMGVRRFLESRGYIEFRASRVPRPGAGRMLVARQFEILNDTPLPPVGPPLTFPRLYKFSLFGALGPGFLSMCSIFGCVWLWPFSDARITWNLLADIDLAFAGVLVAGLLAGMVVRDKKPVRWGMLAAGLYLLVAVVHRERAEGALRGLAAEQGVTPAAVVATPTRNNLVVWRGAIRVGATDLRLAGVRVPPLGRSRTYPGESAEALILAKDYPRLPAASPLRRDLRRFLDWTDGWAAITSDGEGGTRVIDLRTRRLPHTAEPRIAFRVPSRDHRADPDAVLQRTEIPLRTEQPRLKFFRMLIGHDLGPE